MNYESVLTVAEATTITKAKEKLEEYSLNPFVD
jgi:hypothetical protein